MNHHAKTRFHTALLALIVGVLCAAVWLPGCAGAPRSVQQLEEMDSVAFDAWLARVAAWSELASAEYVSGDAEREAKAMTLAAILRASEGAPGSLKDLFEQAGLDSPLAAVLALEADALVDARGGWPVGPRLGMLLTAIASAVEMGAVASERPSK